MSFHFQPLATFKFLTISHPNSGVVLSNAAIIDLNLYIQIYFSLTVNSLPTSHSSRVPFIGRHNVLLIFMTSVKSTPSLFWNVFPHVFFFSFSSKPIYPPKSSLILTFIMCPKSLLFLTSKDSTEVSTSNVTLNGQLIGLLFRAHMLCKTRNTSKCSFWW